MSAAAIAQYLQWLALACTSLTVVFMIGQALLISRPRRLRAGVLVLVVLIDLAAVLALYWFGNVFLSVLWMAGLLVVGIAVGWVVGRSTKTAEKDGRVYGKLSAVAAWLVALSLSVSVGAMFFASLGVFAAALLFSLFAVGMLLGQVVAASARLAGAKSKGNVSAKAPAAVAASPGGEV